MSILNRKDQKKTWKDFYIPIVQDVDLRLDVLTQPHEPEPNQDIDTHMNLQLNLTATKGVNRELMDNIEKMRKGLERINRPMDIYPTIPIGNIHIETPREPTEKGIVDRNSRIYHAIDSAINPLWSNRTLNYGRSTDIIPQPTYKPDNSIVNYGERKGYDMGKPRLTQTVPDNITVGDAFKKAEELKKNVNSVYTGSITSYHQSTQRTILRRKDEEYETRHWF
jgi:hypothetical protein